jgi:hypothetical protein
MTFRRLLSPTSTPVSSPHLHTIPEVSQYESVSIIPGRVNVCTPPPHNQIISFHESAQDAVIRRRPLRETSVVELSSQKRQQTMATWVQAESMALSRSEVAFSRETQHDMSFLGETYEPTRFLNLENLPFFKLQDFMRSPGTYP